MKKVGKRAFWFVLSVLLVLALIAGSAAVGYKWLHHEKRQNIDIETLQNLSGVWMTKEAAPQPEVLELRGRPAEGT